MHENSPSDKFLQWVLAERLARKAASDFLDRAVWPDLSTMPAHFPTKDVVAVLRARANECFKTAMADLDARAVIAAHRGMAAQRKIDHLGSETVDQKSQAG